MSKRGEANRDVQGYARVALAAGRIHQAKRDGGLDIPPGVTFLVGENGSGKSTLIEAIAERFRGVGTRRRPDPEP